MSQLLLLIDGLSTVRRVYGAIESDKRKTPEQCANETRTSTMQSIRKAIRQIGPSHCLVAFDHGGETWRHRLFPAYKANRKPMPGELRAMLPTIRSDLEQYGLTTCAVPDVEADDVIATVAMRWAERGCGSVVVMSTDKDLAQLFSHGAEVWNYFDKEWRDEAWSMKKFGVPPHLIGDCLALMGDREDGVPGLHKCGPKTAADWLNRYGSLDALLENAGKVAGKIGQRLRDGIEEVKMSRALIALKTDVQCGLTWNGLIVR